MPYFTTLRKKQSRFYQHLWQEISEMKIIDTHEYFWTLKDLRDRVAILNNRGEYIYIIKQ